jgi:predicted nucleic acid-binding protein
MWVVDASVAVKWFVDEPGSSAARAVLASGESLLAPDLIVVEASNTAWKKVKRQEMTAKHGEAMVRAIPLFFDRLAPSGSLAARAYVLANQLNHPVYDCLYLALAESEAVELITDDARFIKAVSRTAHRKRIRLLAKFES